MNYPLNLYLAGRISESLKELDPDEPIRVTSAEIAGGFSAFMMAIVFGSTEKIFSFVCPCIYKLYAKDTRGLDSTASSASSQGSETDSTRPTHTKAHEKKKPPNQV